MTRIAFACSEANCRNVIKAEAADTNSAEELLLKNAQKHLSVFHPQIKKTNFEVKKEIRHQYDYVLKFLFKLTI